MTSNEKVLKYKIVWVILTAVVCAEMFFSSIHMMRHPNLVSALCLIVDVVYLNFLVKRIREKV